LVLVVLLLTGCIDYAEAAQRRAASDFACPAKELATTEVTDGTYRVTGCGYDATYTCVVSHAPFEEAHATCIREAPLRRQ
jgi:hypothetical protein